MDDQLTARQRLFPAIGPGLRAVKRGPDGRYYVLASPMVGLAVFDAAGVKRERTIGAPSETEAVPGKGHAVLVFGEDADVDAEGHIYIADRGLNAVIVFSGDGNLLRSIAVNSPVSVAALPEGEVAVATLRDPHLVIVFDNNGRDVREFGDPEQLTGRTDLNRYLSNGLLLSDGLGHLDYGFLFLPEPLVRQFDRYGYAGQDFQYNGIDAMPEASAIRREIEKQERKGGPPSFKKVLTAFGVDRKTGEIWMATHNTLMHFDKEGNRRSTYQIYTPEGARIEANVILVEEERLLIGSDPLGVYDFERPDKKK
ncbi:MAG: hypothetical protein NVS9B13_14460 [Candidatus Acidiferrum sp.]